MLETILIILVVLWALGFFAFHVSGLVHLLLVIAAVILVVDYCRAGESFDGENARNDFAEVPRLNTDRGISSQAWARHPLSLSRAHIFKYQRIKLKGASHPEGSLRKMAGKNYCGRPALTMILRLLG